MDINRLTIMVRIDDTARADIAMTAERTYYRFATDSSIEDGELAPISDFEVHAPAIAQAVRAAEGETPLPAEIKVQLFVNNRIDTAPTSEQSLRRLIDALLPLAPEFAFLSGFAQG